MAASDGPPAPAGGSAATSVAAVVPLPRRGANHTLPRESSIVVYAADPAADGTSGLAEPGRAVGDPARAGSTPQLHLVRPSPEGFGTHEHAWMMTEADYADGFSVRRFDCRCGASDFASS